MYFTLDDTLTTTASTECSFYENRVWNLETTHMYQTKHANTAGIYTLKSTIALRASAALVTYVLLPAATGTYDPWG